MNPIFQFDLQCLQAILLVACWDKARILIPQGIELFRQGREIKAQGKEIEETLAALQAGALRLKEDAVKLRDEVCQDQKRNSLTPTEKVFQ